MFSYPLGQTFPQRKHVHEMSGVHHGMMKKLKWIAWCLVTGPAVATAANWHLTRPGCRTGSKREAR